MGEEVFDHGSGAVVHCAPEGLGKEGAVLVGRGGGGEAEARRRARDTSSMELFLRMVVKMARREQEGGF